MNQKEFSAFYGNIEVYEYFNEGYIYFYGKNISLCRQRLEEIVKESFDETIAYCRMHSLKATVVLTKVRFWKNRQLGLNKKLAEFGCHMDKDTITSLYDCNDYILKRNLAWQKKWENQPIFKAACEAKKKGRKKLFDLF